MTALRKTCLWMTWLLAANTSAPILAEAPKVHEGRLELGPSGSETIPLAGLRAGQTYRIGLTLLKGDLAPADRIHAELRGVAGERLAKDLHAGDPDLYLPYRPDREGEATLEIRGDPGSRTIPLEYRWAEIPLNPDESAAIEAEPNDDPNHANRLILGRAVYGTADDVDYLDNKDEGSKGLDWFRFEVKDDQPILVYFQLDLPDRDVSVNLRVYTIGDDGKPQPYESGKDPMEIVHDRERERYSKHISRTFTKGIYYLQVNANHPAYILRTRKLPVPPYDDPTLAVEAGMHYIMNVGDAWFAQVPREGNIFVRAANIHDTGTRCTACHPSVFSTESNLIAHRNGYPIRSKDNFRYVVDRLYNSITPLYGDDGLYWQRFIAIPLQAQGKQGGIIADFEREVSGRETRTFERFGPFLKAAWAERTDLPPDEQNGVVPLDSKFGFAWRDWQILSEMTRRTGRDDYRKAAENIARIVNAAEAEDRVETLQDRMHQFYAWQLTDPKGNAGRVSEWAGALLALQNEDGGWNERIDLENPEVRGPSSVYATGQMVWGLLRAGVKTAQPEIGKALKYLLSQQQAFGGWFQTTTHENFRTPMRETRYAIEALAEAFPRPGAPLTSWGNRDEGPPWIPVGGSVVKKLDDLENLWDVPEPERARFTLEIVKFLNDPEPLVRASAAACLGRLGRIEAVKPLVRKLADPSKIVWRAAAWGLRTLGNAGVGVEAIAGALRSPYPRTRRGATRIFAYQFYGLDERPELAHCLIDLTDDPDLWTRLQALKTLRQWFYRTNDNVLKRQIVRAYLARMSKPEVPVIRKNLREGMYIMLDENLGGGVSLQKNVSELPERLRPGIFKAREEVERGVLLGPLLSALESGNELQRESIVGSFDGSFFKGRFYARRPEGMLDVGNDREFSFFYEPPVDVLDRAFASLFSSDDLKSATRKQALQLASFFRVPERSTRPAIQSALLKSLADPDPEVRRAARFAVGDGLALKGAESDADQIANIRKNLLGNAEGRRATVRALARNPALIVQPLIRDDLRAMLAREDAAILLQPVLAASIFNDAEVVSALRRGWERADESRDRLAMLEVLFGRASILNVAEPPGAALELLRDAVHDDSAAVRERALRAVAALKKTPWAARVSNSLLLSSLADDTPSLRLLGLTLAAPRASFWARPDAREHLLRLLVDPDPKVRDQALRRVEEHRLMVDHPELARRVKALVGDLQLKDRAASALGSQGYPPDQIKADVTLTRPRLLSLATFRQKVNPIFYKPSADGHACVECHANHTILRISEADPAAGFNGERLMTNYNSVLKVINLGDPDSSLILRKPRSPRGQGGADPESPTGLTHVGGPRWESTDDPSYGVLLSWIRDASGTASTESKPLQITADSYAPGYEPGLAGDGDPTTIWHTEFVGARPGYPHELTIDLGASKKVDGLLYVPRQESPNGRVKDYEVRISEDGKNWGNLVAHGSWENDPTYKFVALPGKVARYVQLRGLNEVEGRPVMSAAELVIDATPATTEAN